MKFFIKAILFIGIFFCASGIFAQDNRSTSFEDNPIRKIRLAKELAEYGYETESASALLEAAEILLELNVRKADAKSVQEGNSSNGSEEKFFSLDAETVLSYAKDFAGNDEIYSGWIKKIEKRFLGRRGAAKGPQSVDGFVYGNDGKSSYNIAFKNGELAQVYVASVEDARLDVAVYDAGGNVVVSGQGNDTITFTPKSAETYMVQIKNRTRANVSYTLFTD